MLLQYYIELMPSSYHLTMERFDEGVNDDLIVDIHNCVSKILSVFWDPSADLFVSTDDSTN